MQEVEDKELNELPSEADFTAKAQAFHRLNETSDTADVRDAAKFYQDVARILDSVKYPMVWDGKPKGFDDRYWKVSDRFHAFLDKLIFTKDEVGMLSKVRMLISGGQSYDEFHGQMKSEEKTVRCGRVFDGATAIYRCSTCSSGPVLLPLCYYCFIAHGHEDHDYQIDFDFKGSCGCGDPEYATASGNCSEHGQSKPDSYNDITIQSLPLIRYLILKLLVRLLTILRYMGAKPPNCRDDIPDILLPELMRALNAKIAMIKNSFGFLYEIINYGKPIRDVFVSLFTDEHLYKILTTGEIPEDALNCVALSKLDWRSSRHFESFTKLFFNPTMLNAFSDWAENFKMKTLLHEFMMFFIFSNFEDVFMDILMALMPDKKFSGAASKIYFLFYPATVTFMRKIEHSCELREEDKKCAHDCCECNLHFSHQLLKNLETVKYLQDDIDLLFIIMCSMQYTAICYKSGTFGVYMKMIPGTGVYYEKRPANLYPGDDCVLRDIQFFNTLNLIGKDLVELWRHKEMASYFFSRKDCQKIYIQVLKELHSMVTVDLLGFESFDIDIFTTANVIEFMISSLPLEQLKKVFSMCSHEQLSYYFAELCNALEAYLSEHVFLDPSSLTFNLLLERQIATVVKFFHMKEQFSNDLITFKHRNALFRRTLPFFLKELAVHSETKFKKWKAANSEIRSLLNITFYSSFRKFFGDLDLYYLRLVAGSLTPDEIMDAFYLHFHIENLITHERIPMNEQRISNEDYTLYEELGDDLSPYLDRFKVELGSSLSYFGPNVGILEPEIQSSENTQNCGRIQLNFESSPESEDDEAYFENAAVDIMNWLSYLIINPDMNVLPDKERTMIKLVHTIQNHPLNLDAIVAAIYGRCHYMDDAERWSIFALTELVCKGYNDPHDEQTKMGSHQFIVKREYYEKYWCPVLSRFSHYSLLFFTAACKVMETLDSEKITENSVRADLWIPYRIPNVTKCSPNIKEMISLLYSENFLNLVHACLALNSEGRLQHTSLQIIVFLLTVAAHYLPVVQTRPNAELFFDIYSVSTRAGSTKTASIYTHMVDLFVSYAKKRTDPSECFENVYNGVYCEDKLAGGLVEYIGRFLSVLAKLEPMVVVILAYTWETDLKKTSKVAHQTCPISKTDDCRKALQQRILESARKKSESLLKKLEVKEKENSFTSSEDDEVGIADHECPICFCAIEPGAENTMAMGILDRICLISSMESPAVSSHTQIIDDEIVGNSNITGKCFARLVGWQQDIAAEQNCTTSYCYIDWRTCNHIYHAKCFAQFRNPQMSLSGAWLFPPRTYCSVCRYQVHALLPVRLTNSLEVKTIKCFNKDKEVYSTEFLKTFFEVLQGIGWRYLDDKNRCSRESYYSRTCKILLNGSAKIKLCVNATKIDRIRQQLEILSKLKVKGWEKLKVGSKEGILKQLLPTLMYETTKDDMRLMEEIVRDLIQPQGNDCVSTHRERINGFTFITDVLRTDGKNDTTDNNSKTTALSPEDVLTLEELKDYGFDAGHKKLLSFDFKSTVHLMKRDLISMFIFIVSAVFESNLSEDDKKEFILVLYSRLVGAYLIKTLVLLLPCITEKCANHILENQESGLKALLKTVYLNRLEARVNPQIDYFDEETGLDLTSLIEHTTQSVAYFVQIVQTFLTDLSVLNIDCSMEALCNFYEKDDISEFVPNKTFVENWLSDLDGAIGYHKSYQTHVPLLSWKTTFFIELPEYFSTLTKKIKNTPCSSCGKTNFAPLLCIICGESICEKHLMNPEVKLVDVDFRTRDHRCQNGYGAFLSLQTADLIVTTNGHAAIYGKLYVNAFGEENSIVKSELYFVEHRLRNFEEDFVLCHYLTKSFLERGYFVETLQNSRKKPTKLTQFFTPFIE